MLTRPFVTHPTREVCNGRPADMFVSEVAFLMIGRPWGAYLGDPAVAAATYTVQVYHLTPEPSRSDLERALCLAAGDFASVDDFTASWRQGNETCGHCGHVSGVYGASEWADPESEYTFNDCIGGYDAD